MMAPYCHHGFIMTDAASNFKSYLADNGLSIADWARERGYNVRTVYAVLNGELKARRGIGHKIAVDAGLKGRLQKAA